MVPSPFALMRKHLKKSIVYGTLAGSFTVYTYDYSRTNDVMRISCQKAAKWGDMKLKNPTAPTRHITVILNPVACKRKSKKLYTKWVEPLLHLAGIKVSLIETHSPNQAFDLMKIMSNCDGVAIVGGDGTVNEALNGLLSRPDCVQAVKNFPLGIIPAGQNNSIARYIHQNNIEYRNQKEFLIQSTLRLVDCITEDFDVLKITPVDKDTHNPETPTYALRDVRYGKYQDNIFKVSGFVLYQTYVKPVWLRIHSIFSNKYPSPAIQSVSYTSPCDGCSRCIERHKLRESQPSVAEDKNASRRWWGMLAPIPTRGSTEEEKREKELALVDNPECTRWMRVEGGITDFRASMVGDKLVRLSLSRQGEYSPSEVIEAQDVRLRVNPELDKASSMTGQEADQIQSELDEQPEIGNEKKLSTSESEKHLASRFLIDGQPKPAHSIEITSLSNAITLFTGPFYGRINKRAQ